MQAEETRSEGLTREFAITIPSGEIEEKVSARLQELSRTVKMPGFRPGKVPVSLLRKQYGPSVMGEVLERTISESSAATLRDNRIRPAVQPKVRITEFDEGKDLKYTMSVEVMPDIQEQDFSKIALERLVVEVTDGMVDEAIRRIAEEQRRYEKVEEDRPATAEDALVVDFTGTVDGKEFPGGAATDFVLELSSPSFIPGFVDQLIGARAGEKRAVKVGFPADYPGPDLAGKEATFDVTVKEHRARRRVEADEALAKSLGLESLDAMRKMVRERLQSEYGSISRMRLKRSLLDALADRADFAVPTGMVEQEFAQIWRSISGEAPEGQSHDHGHGSDHDHEHDHEHDHDHGHDHGEGPDLIAKARFKEYLEESGKSVEELRAEYSAIAERRVRLGLLLAETGNANGIKVTDEELNRAVVNEARRFPGQERNVIEYYQKSRGALEQLRGPLFEDKVVDYILELADVTDRKVSADELMRDPDDEGGAAPDPGAEGGEGDGRPEGAASGKRAPAKTAAAKPGKGRSKG
ncbi:MAG TPA: trigger factor [Alphaproteobacteria bacterium]|jgi:trigger factor